MLHDEDIEDLPNTINILLMGETGVGKSTFINSFANYIRSGTFDDATRTKTLMLIPTRVTVYDDDTMEDRSLVFGFDRNEEQSVGASATQGVKTYIFPIEGANALVRMIDTPGLGDTAGPDKDDRNCESILSYLAQLSKINAICLLMKPSNDRNTVLFSYCVRRILSQLHKSACENVVFLFTNTKGSDYRPGATFPILKKLSEEVASEPPHVKIPLTRNNVFCVDNESFKHLLALEHGIEVNPRTLESCKTSWKISCEEIVRFRLRLLKYVRSLTPHNVKQTVSVNKTRDLILQLSKPLSDICQLLQDKIANLKTKDVESSKSNQTIEELKSKLYKPGVELEVIRLSQPAMICTSRSCVEPVEVGGTTKFVCKKRCHDPCLLGYVLLEIVGHWSLVTCSEMTLSFFPKCKHCECSYTKHMAIFYDTKLVEKQVIDEDVRSTILSEEKERERINVMIMKIKEEKKELESELEYVSECAARFAYFLKHNAITSSYDNFKEYIYLSLQRQKSLGSKANMDEVANLTELLQKHENFVKAVGEKQGCVKGDAVTEESVFEDAERLFKLKHVGPKIKEIFDARSRCVKSGRKIGFRSVFTEAIPSWFMV